MTDSVFTAELTQITLFINFNSYNLMSSFRKGSHLPGSYKQIFLTYYQGKVYVVCDGKPP